MSTNVLVISILRYLSIVGLLLWISLTVIIFGVGYNVTTFNPEDDIIKILEETEDKIDWRLSFENSTKTRKISLRVCISPNKKLNHDSNRKTAK